MVKDLGVQDSGFKVWFGVWVQGPGFRNQNSGFRAQGGGWRVEC